jgi:uncharacterized protein involved in exopolysaccharide biosynthesis
MGDSFDAFRYIGYVRARWRWVLASCGIAVGLALAVSMAMPRQFTATARIVIEPPAGADLRAAMAVSPIYLESLKTYEQFAAGDSLFQKALEKFELRDRPIESVKKRVLKVQIVRNTRILEISATLPDAKKAQALARFLAESTVELNRSMVTESDQDLLRGMEQQEKEIRSRLQATDAAWAQALANEPVAGMQAAMEQAGEMRSAIQQQIQSVELEIADAAERAKLAQAGELAEIRKQASNAHARLEQMRKQMLELDRQGVAREQILATRMAHHEQLEAERKASQAALAAMDTRLRDARGESGFRGERLKMIDPGIVPERPSSPNLPLNVAAALLLGLVLPVLYLTLAMNYQEQRAESRRTGYRAVAKTRDE